MAGAGVIIIIVGLIALVGGFFAPAWPGIGILIIGILLLCLGAGVIVDD